ncbi:MAG: CsbD family protein [Candidatus Acidiferrales bacterium]
MNWDQLQGSWKEYRGKIREQWGKLTDDDLDIINGKREQLVGRIQHHYGVAKDMAEEQTDQFLKGFTGAKPRQHK